MAEVLDAHHHLWRYNRDEYGWIGPEMPALRRDFLPNDLANAMQSAAVDGSILVQARQTLAETDWLLDVAAENPAIRGVVGWLPLTQEDAPSLVREYAANSRLKGVRHQVQDEPDENFILRDDFNRGVAALLDTRLVYDILILRGSHLCWTTWPNLASATESPNPGTTTCSGSRNTTTSHASSPAW
jgi:L-fuconolactonase